MRLGNIDIYPYLGSVGPSSVSSQMWSSPAASIAAICLDRVIIDLL